MANGMYYIAKQNMENGTFNWLDGEWSAQLCNGSYIPNLATDSSDAAWSGDALGSPAAIAGNAISSAGVLSANSITVTGISSGQTVNSVVVYHYNGSVSWPAFYFDTGTGLPLTTTGAAVTIDWNGTVSSGNLMTL
jgi:hypothetical protein